MKFATKLAVAGTVIGLMAGVGQIPASAGSPPIPDLSIKEPGGVGFVGDGVYAGAVGQNGFAEIGFGQTAVFRIRIQQDTTHVAPITVDGDRGSTHFGVKYFKGQQNISKAVRKGTYTTPPLTVGQKKTIRMEIKAKDSVYTGIGFFVSGSTPGGLDDTVLAEVANCGPTCVP